MNQGVWVTNKNNGHMCKVTKVEGGRVYGYWHGSSTESWVKKSDVRLSTNDEIEEEKKVLSNLIFPHYFTTHN